MNRVAFIFSSAPHGTAAGREGLDALLATAALSKNIRKDIGIFFISDGVFQLLDGQKPQAVLARDYISTFKLLSLYDIETFFVCAASLKARGLPDDIPMVVNPTIIDPYVLRKELTYYNTVLTF